MTGFPVITQTRHLTPHRLVHVTSHFRGPEGEGGILAFQELESSWLRAIGMAGWEAEPGGAGMT